MKSEWEDSVLRSLQSHGRYGGIALLALALGLGGWAKYTSISGAVVASGQVVVETDAKKVQHKDGGIVSEIKVREGALVQAGELLFRLDDTSLRADLQIVRKQINELTAIEARSLAERDGLTELRFPVDLEAQMNSDADAAASAQGQARIFASSALLRRNRRDQLLEQINQLEATIEGLTVQRQSRADELALLDNELMGVQELYRKSLISLTRLTALQRDRTRLDGERGKLIADIASAKGAIAEKRVAILRLDDEFRSETLKSLSETRAKLAELAEKRVAAEDRLARIVIRAPQAGRVHGLAVHTVGGVIQPGETAMLIVPLEDRLIVDASIDPIDINEVRFGQRATVKFGAFHDRQIQDTEGEVINVSPTPFEDSANKRKFYIAKIKVGIPIGGDGKELSLVPGMPADVFLLKGDRTVLSYLMKPLREQFSRVWRE